MTQLEQEQAARIEGLCKTIQGAKDAISFKFESYHPVQEALSKALQGHSNKVYEAKEKVVQRAIEFGDMQFDRANSDDLMEALANLEQAKGEE